MMPASCGSAISRERKPLAESCGRKRIIAWIKTIPMDEADERLRRAAVGHGADHRALSP